MCCTHNYDGGRVSWKAKADTRVEECVRGPAGMVAGEC